MVQRLRSMLFSPANRVDLIGKLPRTGADLLVIDLEDGTPEAEKSVGRLLAIEQSRRLRADFGVGNLYLRTNAFGTRHFGADLEAAVAAEVAGVVVPKVSSVSEIAQLEAALADAEHKVACVPRNLVVGLETVAGIEWATPILHASTRAIATYFGAEDFTADLGARRSAEGVEVLYARSRVVLSARLAGVAAFDQVVVDIRDDERFLADATLGRNMGYDGKMCVHPRQVELTHRVFAPTAAEVERATRLLRHYEEAVAAGMGTTDFEGQMIDLPLVAQARRMLTDGSS